MSHAREARGKRARGERETVHVRSMIEDDLTELDDVIECFGSDLARDTCEGKVVAKGLNVATARTMPAISRVSERLERVAQD